MLEECPNCGVSVLFTGSLCPACQLDKYSPDPQQLAELRARLVAPLSPMMKAHQPSDATDNRLLVLGLLSLLLLPLTAVPGILIGRRQAKLSARGRFGYILCWVCMAIFLIGAIILGSFSLLQHWAGPIMRSDAGETLNHSVERMAAVAAALTGRERLAAAIAHFYRWLQWLG
jgi:hypothetical protein